MILFYPEYFWFLAKGQESQDQKSYDNLFYNII